MLAKRQDLLAVYASELSSPCSQIANQIFAKAKRLFLMRSIPATKKRVHKVLFLPIKRVNHSKAGCLPKGKICSQYMQASFPLLARKLRTRFLLKQKGCSSYAASLGQKREYTRYSLICWWGKLDSDQRSR